MMAEQGQEEAGGEYVEHQYMCSECQQLFNTLEEVLVHQQIHTGQDVEGDSVPEMGESQHYQCLECGSLLVNADELLQHQEMHMREAGMEVEQQGEIDACWKHTRSIKTQRHTNTDVFVVVFYQSFVRFWRWREPAQRLRVQNPFTTNVLTVWLCLTRLIRGWSTGEPTAGAAHTVTHRPQ